MEKYFDLYNKLKTSMTIEGKLHPRFYHSVETAKIAVKLSKHLNLGLDEDKVYLAGLLHDAAKLIPDEQLWEIISINESKEICDELIKYPHIWHSLAGKYYVKEFYKIKDLEILDAIYYHTTGRAKMNKLEALIFACDYIEPTRKQTNYLINATNACFSSLDEGVYTILTQMVDYLKKSGKIIYSRTLEAYNYYKKERKE